MKRPEAAKLFKDYAWDTTEKATKDLTRYQSDPGQATAYMIGQLAIWKLRNYTKSSLENAKIAFNEKEFHFHVLSQGRLRFDFEFLRCLGNRLYDYLEYCLQLFQTSFSISS